MSRFTADYSDYSSSINSTPAKAPPSQQRSNQLFSSNPSQFPSTTPIAPPPSQIFGSSGFGTGVSKLQFPQSSNPTPSGQAASRPFHTSFGTSQASEYTEQDDHEYSDGGVEEEEEDDNDDGDQTGPIPSAFRSVNNPPVPSLMKFSTTSSRQSRVIPFRRSVRSSRISALPHKGDESIVVNLARDLGSRSHPAPLGEPDQVIMQTENLLRSLEDQLQRLKTSNESQQFVGAAARHLLDGWQRFAAAERPTFDSPDVGPPSTSSLFSKANYLVSLLLTLRHPRLTPDGDLTPTPQILLEWLDQHHVSYDELYHNVATCDSNCTASPIFWGAVQSFVLRGKLQFAMQLFAEADFKYAASAVDDGGDSPGYKGAQLQSIQSIIYKARLLLNSCPAIQNDDWNVAGREWDLFRAQVEAELDSLNELAVGHDDDDDNSFEAENFGIRKPGANLLTKLGRKSTSTIPWSIFTGLKIVYNILLGSAEEIVAQSQDWLEAVTSLTIWWDGTADAAVAQWSFDVSRANNMAEDDDNDINPYLNRLRESFLSVTSPEIKNGQLRMNTMSPVEVGLGNILQGNVTGSLIILRTLSQCIASSVAEIGALAGWLELDSRVRPAGLNEDDLMVLSYGAPKHGVSKDELMLGYAEALFEKPDLIIPGEGPVEGWEVALSVVSRLDDREAMHNAVSNFIEQLDVVSQDRAEKLAELCNGLGLKEEAQKVSDRFGDYLVNHTTEYGTALLCYARSHSSNKVRQLVDLLISYSLVQSRAYPPDDELDQGLQDLVENPRTALADIAEIDPDAAEILQFYLVGYACLRRFYTLRDEGINPSKAGKPSGLRPLARRRAASKALVTAINSAADSIYGGLYDPERQSAIQVDGLLTLLGEATALLSNDDHSNKSYSTTTTTFTATQIYALLAAIEDLSTVSSRVYDATEECLQAALRNFHGSQPPSPHAMLKKTMSSGTTSNFSFSMMGSEMISASSSGVLVSKPGGGGGSSKGPDDAFRRGWDWRAGFRDRNTSGKDVVRSLRVKLARELSLAELEE